MILEESYRQFNSSEEFRNFLKEATKRRGIKPKYIVGVKDHISETEAYATVDMVAPIIRNQGYKVAAAVFIVPQTGKSEPFNVIFAENIDEDEVLYKFLYGNLKYSLKKIFIMD